MFELSLQACADAMNSPLIGQDVIFDRVSTDTRTLKTGDVFVALVGENFDAHDKIDNKVTDKASALVVQKPIQSDTSYLLVDDTLRALGDLAREWRKQISVPLIAITGSNGKTTVKEMAASILRQRGNVFATCGNLNNEIGMPLSILSTRHDHDFMVLELGANHAGEIAYLAGIARPLVALVNNAGPSHLEGFGSLDGVATAKGEIYSGLSDQGVAIINVDDCYADQWRKTATGKSVIGFGFDPSADVRGELSSDNKLTIFYQKKSVALQLPLPGKHNALNALAAAAATLAIGTTLGEVAAGLQTVKATRGRLEFKTGINGCEIIDDSYNANPGSLSAGLNVLCEGVSGRAICVLGDMRELGDAAANIHRETGAAAKQSGVNLLYSVGEFAHDSVAGFGAGGQVFEAIDELVEQLKNSVQKNDRVLIKGSRSARMERVVEALLENNKQQEIEAN